MVLPRLMLDEQKSSVHSRDFSSEDAVKSMEVRSKYLAIIYEGTACRILNE
jgi:hypothetical protein